MLRLRFITGIILAAGVIALLWWGPNWGVKAFLAVACFVGLFEYASLGHKISTDDTQGTPDPLKLAPIMGFAAFLGWTLAPHHGLLIAGASVTSVTIIHTIRCRDLSVTVARIAWDILGIFYVSGLLSVAAAIVGESEAGSHSRALFLTFLAAISSGDTLAYFTGRAFGKRPLAPILSPKKTVEGAIGGLGGSALGAYLMWSFLNVPGEIHWIIATALVAGSCAQVGDLFESLLKRNADVKDSGKILPGHGGVLDRLDGILFGAPIFLLYKILVV